MVDYNKEIIELLNKLSSEMCSKIDGIHFEINSMKSAISTLNNKIEKNSKTMDALCKNISELCKSRDMLAKKIEKLNPIDNNKIIELENEIKKVDDSLLKTYEIVSKENSSTYNKLDSVSVDLKFITHKILQSEKDLFNIQEKLKDKN